MKRKILVISILSLASIAFGKTADMGNYGLESFSSDFAAPVVPSRANLANATTGAIVYEWNGSAGGFYGLPAGANPTSAGNWVALSPPVGTGTVVSADPERVERVTVSSQCTSSPCTIPTNGNTAGITSVTRNTTGTYTVNFATSPAPFSAAPTCVVNSNFYLTLITSFPTTSGFQFETLTLATALVDTAFTVICMGPQ